MSSATRRTSLSWILAAALLVLLAVLATLQHRWLGEVSEAQRERTIRTLERSARQFATDFDRELTRILVYAQSVAATGDARALAELHELWSETAPYPQLIREILRVDREGPGEARLERFDPRTGALVATAWPEKLEGLRRRLQEGSFPFPPGGEPWNPLDGETPAVVVPLGFGPPPRMRHHHPPTEDEESMRDAMRLRHHQHLVFVLDPQPLLAELAERYFGDGGLELHVRITDRERPERPVFESGPEVRAARTTADAESDLFGFLDPGEVRRLQAEVPFDAARGRRRVLGLGAASLLERRWRLAVIHPGGSLDAAVEATRRRNMAISLGILALLGTTAFMLLLATRRAQQLARRQIELVAGVTHELRTPLAALRSAGANLADGVVRDEPQVRRYGTLIEREGRRLSDMVEQMLEFAGIQSGRRGYQQERLAVRDLVDSALAESRPLLEAGGFEVETEIAEGVPDVMADAAALRRALGNLIVNAVKYAARGAWLAVTARGAGGEVRIAVEDRGPGIAEEDLPHLFEPFYRGRDLAAGRVPGSGLGLALVRQVCEAHGGRVSVTSREGEGSTFTLHLPAASAAEEKSLRTEAVEA